MKKNSDSSKNGFVMVFVMMVVLIIGILGIGLRTRARGFLMEVAHTERDMDAYWAVQGAAEYVASLEGQVMNLNSTVSRTLNGVTCNINVGSPTFISTNEFTVAVSVSGSSAMKEYTLTQTNLYEVGNLWDLPFGHVSGDTNLLNSGGFSGFLQWIDSILSLGIAFDEVDDHALTVLGDWSDDTTFSSDAANSENDIVVGYDAFSQGGIIVEAPAAILVAGATSNFNGTATETNSTVMGNSSTEVGILESRMDEYANIDADALEQAPIVSQWFGLVKTAELAGGTYKLGSGDYGQLGRMTIVGPGTIVVDGDMSVLGNLTLTDGAELVVQGKYSGLSIIQSGLSADNSTIYAEEGAGIYGRGGTLTDVEFLASNIHMTSGDITGFIYAPNGVSFLGLDFEGVLMANQLAMFSGSTFTLNEGYLPYYFFGDELSGSSLADRTKLVSRSGWNLSITGIVD